MKRRMRFLAVAVLSLAMTTAFGQTSTQGTQGTGSSGSDVFQQDRTQSGQGTRQDDALQGGQTGTQSGQGVQGMGAGSAEAKVRSEVQWMKSEFNLTDQQEQRLHDVLLKYESQAATGADASKLKEEKEKELKTIIGEDNYKIYKEKKKDRDKDDRSGSGTLPQSR